MKKLVTFTYLIVFTFFHVWAQISSGDFPKNCPAYPTVRYFSPDCYMYVDEIQFGQGRIQAEANGFGAFWGGAPRDVYVPCNRPEWAIASIHAWQLMRNTLGKEYYNKHVFFATALQESFFNCAPDLDWSCYADLKHPLDGVNGEYRATPQPDGCFHLSHPGYAWLKEYMPHRHQESTYKTYISGDNFIRGAISKVHYDLLGVRFYEHGKGHEPLELFEIATDEFAADVWNALHYNKGYGAAGLKEPLSAANRANSAAQTDFVYADGAFQYTYPYSLKRTAQVLSKKYTGGSPNNEWHNWYDHDIDWKLMDFYMDEVFIMYPELSATEVASIKSKVQAVFNTQDKDKNGTVSFRYEFGPVLDAFILAMPYDDPMTSILNTQNGYGGCSGCVGPVVDLKANTPTKVCKGIKVELETTVGNNYTYQWKKDDKDITNSNAEQHILYAEETGFYSVVVTNDKGCAIASECPVYVEIENCSNCDLSAKATITQNSCTGFEDGKIDVTLSGTSYNSSKNYTYEIGGDTVLSQKSSSILNIKDGAYTIKVIDPNDATCQANTFVTIAEQVPFYYKMDLIKDSLACDKFAVTAKATGNPPSTCTYNFKITGTADGTGKCWGNVWESTTSGGTKRNSGAHPKVLVNDVQRLEVNPVGSTSGGACTLQDFNFDVNKGDKIDLTVFAIKSGGTVSNLGKFNYVLTDAEGNETTIPLGGSYKSPGETIVYTTTATCKQALPTFDFTWTPNTSSVDTDTTSKISVTQTATTTYKVKAIASTDPTELCPLEKEIKLKNQCGSNCDEPIIDTEPQDVTICVGEEATFSVSASGDDLTYQWYKGGTKLSGETKATLTIASVSNTDVGDYSVVVTEDCGSETTSKTVKLTTTSPLIPTISIQASETVICSGTKVDFSIDAQSNEGSNPSYQWKSSVQGDLGTGTTLSLSNLVDKEKITLELTSNASCTISNTAISNEVEISITTGVTPSITITSDKISICVGGEVNFSIDAQSHEGSSPSYDWLVNGTSSEETGTAFKSSSLSDGDKVSVTLTSDASCTTTNKATSNEITINHSSQLTPSITITSDKTSICDGGEVNFSIDVQQNEGSTPTYDWLVNGTSSGETGTTFKSNTLKNGDKVSVVLTSSEGCVTKSTANSNEVSMVITQPLTPNITITSNKTTICDGETVDFSIDKEENQGSFPTYQWKSSEQGDVGTATTLSLSNLKDGETITLELTSDLACVNPTTVTSNGVEINVTTQVTPTVEIEAKGGTTICAGEEVEVEITKQDGSGNTPTFDWLINGTSSGETGTTFKSSSLSDGDKISVAMTSSSSC
ncbi:MAG: hypothetical protein GY827_01635, partial [Cytophagales bacterium]|nr:hypothetical protein [Cytophagales bacterium]